MDINTFFDQNKNIKHNSEARSIPVRFKEWRNDDNLCEKLFHWIRFESNAASLKLDINTDIAEVVQEVTSRQFLGIPHRQESSSGWRSIVLHGISSIMSKPPHSYVELGIDDVELVEQWTDVCKIFPKTMNWITNNIPFTEFSRIRIMILDPGGYIAPHKDFSQRLLGGGLNIALTNPAGVKFCLEEGGLVPWKEGDVRMIDIGRLHSVKNTSNETRIHILAYPKGMDWPLEAMQLVCKSYESEVSIK